MTVHIHYYWHTQLFIFMTNHNVSANSQYMQVLT